MWVVIEFWADNLVATVYGPFHAIEAAEEFRSKRKDPSKFDVFILCDETLADE